MAYHGTEHEGKPGRRRPLWVRLVMVLLLAGLAGAGYTYRDQVWARVSRLAATAEEPIPVMPAEKVSFQLEVPAFGEITGLDSVPLTTPMTRSGGLRIAWLAPEGTFVKPGDRVVRFDSTEARLNLEKQEHVLQANQERVKITTGKQTTDEKVLGIDRADAEKEYEYATVVAPKDETIFAKWEIIEAQINAQIVQERISVLTNKGRVQKRSARADQQILAIERNKAQAEIGIARQTLDSLEIKAPREGLVIYRRERMRDPQVGDETWPGQVLIELVDLKALQARIYVLEMDAGLLAKGKSVTIRLDAMSEKEFHGEIRSAATLAQPLERNSPLKYFACEVTVRDAYDDLPRIKPGMSLKSNIILEKYDACYILPASAISTKGSDQLVHIKQGDRFVARPVKVGVGTHGQSVVLSGLNEQEVVAMRHPYETRKSHLPDFSKAAPPPGGGMGGGMRIMMGR